MKKTSHISQYKTIYLFFADESDVKDLFSLPENANYAEERIHKIKKMLEASKTFPKEYIKKLNDVIDRYQPYENKKISVAGEYIDPKGDQDRLKICLELIEFIENYHMSNDVLLNHDTHSEVYNTYHLICIATLLCMICELANELQLPLKNICLKLFEYTPYGLDIFTVIKANLEKYLYMGFPENFPDDHSTVEQLSSLRNEILVIKNLFRNLYEATTTQRPPEECKKTALESLKSAIDTEGTKISESILKLAIEKVKVLDISQKEHQFSLLLFLQITGEMLTDHYHTIPFQSSALIRLGKAFTNMRHSLWHLDEIEQQVAENILYANETHVAIKKGFSALEAALESKQDHTQVDENDDQKAFINLAKKMADQPNVILTREETLDCARKIIEKIHNIISSEDFSDYISDSLVNLSNTIEIKLFAIEFLIGQYFNFLKATFNYMPAESDDPQARNNIAIYFNDHKNVFNNIRSYFAHSRCFVKGLWVMASGDQIHHFKMIVDIYNDYMMSDKYHLNNLTLFLESYDKNLYQARRDLIREALVHSQMGLRMDHLSLESYQSIVEKIQQLRVKPSDVNSQKKVITAIYYMSQSEFMDYSKVNIDVESFVKSYINKLPATFSHNVTIEYPMLVYGVDEKMPQIRHEIYPETKKGFNEAVTAFDEAIEALLMEPETTLDMLSSLESIVLTLARYCLHPTLRVSNKAMLEKTEKHLKTILEIKKDTNIVDHMMNKIRIRYRLAQIYMQEKVDLAISYLEEAIAQLEEHKNVCDNAAILWANYKFELARLYFSTAKYDLALACFAQSLKFCEDNAPTSFSHAHDMNLSVMGMASVYVKKNAPLSAVKLLNQYIELNENRGKDLRNYPDLHSQKALILRDIKEYSAASHHLILAIDLLEILIAKNDSASIRDKLLRYQHDYECQLIVLLNKVNIAEKQKIISHTNTSSLERIQNKRMGDIESTGKYYMLATEMHEKIGELAKTHDFLKKAISAFASLNPSSDFNQRSISNCYMHLAKTDYYVSPEDSFEYYACSANALEKIAKKTNNDHNELAYHYFNMANMALTQEVQRKYLIKFWHHIAQDREPRASDIELKKKTLHSDLFVNVLDEKGKAAIHYAALYSDLESLRVLSSDMNRRCSAGKIALDYHIESVKPNTDIFLFLLKNSALTLLEKAYYCLKFSKPDLLSNVLPDHPVREQKDDHPSMSERLGARGYLIDEAISNNNLIAFIFDIFQQCNIRLEKKDNSYEGLLKLACKQIVKNWKTYDKMISDDIDSICNNAGDANTWADRAILHALSTKFKITFVLIKEHGPSPMVYRGAEKSCALSFSYMNNKYYSLREKSRYIIGSLNNFFKNAENASALVSRCMEYLSEVKPAAVVCGHD